MEGQLEVVEIGKTLGPGSVIGEIGVFAPDRKRTATVVVCATDCVVYELTESKTRELYFQNPAFGYAVMQLIVGRLLENQRFGVAQSATALA
jgi:CRP-like cAMP-binding protein